MKASSPLFLSAAVFAALILLLIHAPAANSVTCNPMELSSCGGAILSGTPPTATCCAKLKEQTPCFCQYERNPSLKSYISSPNAKKVTSICKVPTPKC